MINFKWFLDIFLPWASLGPFSRRTSQETETGRFAGGRKSHKSVRGCRKITGVIFREVMFPSLLADVHENKPDFSSSFFEYSQNNFCSGIHFLTKKVLILIIYLKVVVVAPFVVKCLLWWIYYYFTLTIL